MNTFVKKVDGVLMAEIPADVAEKLGIVEGDAVDLRKSDMDDDMKLVEQIMAEDDDVLRRLAQ